MRTFAPALLIGLCVSAIPLQAAEQGIAEAVEYTPAPAPAEEARVELGGGVVMPRSVFEQLAAREDGLAMIERMQQQAEETRRFEGVPHMILVFGSVLLFFWSAMIYYQRKHARLHRTIQLMVEKGLTVPPEILRAAEKFEAGSETAPPPGAQGATPPWASNLLWGGVFWMVLGATGMLILYLRHSDSWPWGIVGIVYGLACIATVYRKQPAAN
jgi:hypothetical protein